MAFKIINLLCLLSVFFVIEAAFVKRETISSPPNQNVFESFHKNLENFRNCIDQSLAKATDELNEKQLMPIFSVVGDSLNRVSKAFEDLTAPIKTGSSNH